MTNSLSDSARSYGLIYDRAIHEDIKTDLLVFHLILDFVELIDRATVTPESCQGSAAPAGRHSL